MTKTLYLPDNVAQKINEERSAEKSEEGPIDSAYVDATQKVLDPSLLDKPLLDRLPQPTGWRILVMPYQGKATTQGGLYIPEEVRDREAIATVVCYVLKIGPLAYKDKDKFGKDSNPWCKEEIGFALADTLDLVLKLKVVKFVLLMMMRLLQPC